MTRAIAGLPPAQFDLAKDDSERRQHDELTKHLAQAVWQPPLTGDTRTGASAKEKTEPCSFLMPVQVGDSQKPFKPESLAPQNDRSLDFLASQRRAVQVSLAGIAHTFRPAQLEDALTKLVTGPEGGIDSTKLGFDLSIKSKLVQALFAHPPVISKDVAELIKKCIDEGQIQPKLADSLRQVLDGKLDETQAKKLLEEMQTGGLFDKKKFLEALQTEIKEKTWGPVSQAAFVDISKYSVDRANESLAGLAQAQYRYYPLGWGVQVAPGQSFEQFQKDVLDKKVQVTLPHDEAVAPSKETCEKLLNICFANGEARAQLDAAERLRLYDTIQTIARDMGRPGWIPRARKEPFNPEWERRAKEIGPIVSLYEQAKSTETKLETMLKFRAPGGGGGWQKDFSEAFGGKTEMASKWIDDALKSMPRSKDGRLLMPETLEYGTRDMQDMKRVQDWLSANKDRIDELYKKVMSQVLNGETAIFGDRPKLEVDPPGDYNLVRDRCKVYQPGDEVQDPSGKRRKLGADEYMVETRTSYMKSDFLYDLAASEVLPAKVHSVIAKKGDLYPVVDLKRGTLSLVEVEQLQSQMDSAKSAKNIGTALEIGLDVAMIYTGGKLIVAAGEQAAKEAGKQVVKSMIRRSLERLGTRACWHGMLDVAIGASGPLLNNANARWADPDLQFANKARHCAIVGTAGLHVASSAKSAIGYSSEAAATATRVTLADRVANGTMLAGAVWFAPQVMSQSLSHFRGGQPGKDADAREALLGSSSVHTTRMGANDNGTRTLDTKLDGTQLKSFVEASRLLLAADNAEITVSVNKIAEISKQLKKLPADSPEREAVTKQLVDRFRNGTSPEEKLAACASLVEAAKGRDGKIAPAIGGVSTESELLPHLRNISSIMSLDSKQSTPERALIAARARLMAADMENTEYLHLCDHLSKRADAADAIKMQSILDLGFGMWAAHDKERNFKSPAEEFAYWSRSNGVSRQDLQDRLTEIANGSAPNVKADLRAFAAGVLHAINRESQDDRLELLGQTMKLWSDNAGKPSGSFTCDFVSRLSNDMQFDETKANNPAALAQMRDRQFMAASAISVLLPALKQAASTNDLRTYSEGSLSIQVAETLASCVDAGNPNVAWQAAAALMPARREALLGNPSMAPHVSEQVLRNVLDILKSPNGDNVDERAAVTMKTQLVSMLPQLLKNSDQSANAVKILESMLRPGRNFANQSPELRLQAIDSLRRIGDAAAQQVLKDVLKFDGSNPVEPSPTVRMAAYQALCRLVPLNNSQQNESLKQFLQDQKKLEKEPRLLAVLEGLREQRLEQPVPRPDSTRFNSEAKKLEFPGLIKKAIDSYKDDAAQIVGKFGNLDVAQFNEKIAKSTPDYEGIGGFKRWTADWIGYGVATGEGWVPGKNKGPEDYKREERENIRYQYNKDFDNLLNMARGKMPDGAPAPEAEQVKAVKALAYLIKSGGTIDDKKVFFDNPQQYASAAKCLAALCMPKTPPAVRAQAKDVVLELVQIPGQDARVLGGLLGGVQQLFDWGAEDITASKRSQALISKEEASVLVALVLNNMRSGSLPEREQRPDSPKEQKDYDERLAASRNVQKWLMKQIVWTHQNREAVNLLEQVYENTKDPLLKAAARQSIDQTHGIEVRHKYYSLHPDEGKSSSDRARDMQSAISRVTDDVSAQEAADAILRNSWGQPLTDDDARVAVLHRALNHHNEIVRTAAAYVTLSIGVTKGMTSSPYFYRSVGVLADVSANGNNPHMKAEAQRRLDSLQTQVDLTKHNLQMAADRAQADLAKDQGNPDKQRKALELSEQLKKHESILKSIEEHKGAAARKRLGITGVVLDSVRNMQEAPLEVRTSMLQSVINGKQSGDPARAIFNAAFEPNPEAKPGQQKWMMLSTDDPRMSALKQLATNRDERISAAANLAIAHLSAEQKEINASIDRLKVLAIGPANPLTVDLKFRLVELQGLRATRYLRNGDLAAGEKDIEQMIEMDKANNGGKNSALIGSEVRAQIAALRSYEQAMAGKVDNATLQRAAALRARIEALLPTNTPKR